MFGRLRRISTADISILGFVILTALCLIVIGASVTRQIRELSGWIYVGLSVVSFLSLTVVFLSPHSIEANIPGIGPISIEGRKTRSIGDGEGKTGSGASDQNQFETLIDLVRETSPRLAMRLNEILDSGYENPFEATAGLLLEGKKRQERNPIKETLEFLESDLKAKDFIVNSDNHDMDVVQITDNQVITKLDENHYPPELGLEFKLYAKTAVDVEGTTETFPEWVGTVRVEEVNEPLCVMEAISWSDDLTNDPANRNSELMQRGSWVEISLEEAEDLDWDTMEEVYDKLKSLQERGEVSHAG